MENRTLSILFQAGPIESLDVVGFRMERRLGKIAVAEVDVRSAVHAEPDELLGIAGRVALGHDEADHEFCGVVTSVGMVMTPKDANRAEQVYRIQLSSALARLEQAVDCTIFQDKD